MTISTAKRREQQNKTAMVYEAIHLEADWITAKELAEKCGTFTPKEAGERLSKFAAYRKIDQKRIPGCVQAFYKPKSAPRYTNSIPFVTQVLDELALGQITKAQAVLKIDAHKLRNGV